VDQEALKLQASLRSRDALTHHGALSGAPGGTPLVHLEDKGVYRQYTRSVL